MGYSELYVRNKYIAQNHAYTIQHGVRYGTVVHVKLIPSAVGFYTWYAVNLLFRPQPPFASKLTIRTEVLQRAHEFIDVSVECNIVSRGPSIDYVNRHSRMPAWSQSRYTNSSHP